MAATAFIGLGTMDAALAAKLRRAGHAVRGGTLWVHAQVIHRRFAASHAGLGLSATVAALRNA